MNSSVQLPLTELFWTWSQQPCMCSSYQFYWPCVACLLYDWNSVAYMGHALVRCLSADKWVCIRGCSET